MRRFFILVFIFTSLFSSLNSVKALDEEYTIYNVGDSVTLVDGTKWHVISYSGDDSDSLTIFSDYFVLQDGTQYQSWDIEWPINNLFSITSENFGKFDDGRLYINNTFCSEPVDGEEYTYCNIYEKADSTITIGDRSGTVSEDSYIKKYLNDKFLPNLKLNLVNNKGLDDSISVRLMSIDEIANIEELNLSSSSVNNISQKDSLILIANLKTNWLKAYSSDGKAPYVGYYTMSPALVSYDEDYNSSIQSEYVYAVTGDGVYITNNLAGEFYLNLNGIVGGSTGIRPVVILNKANVIGSKENKILNNIDDSKPVDKDKTEPDQTKPTLTNKIENPKTLDLNNNKYLLFIGIGFIGVCGLIFSLAYKAKKSK